jgi:hypothetical protein
METCKKTLKSLCWSILGRFEQLDKDRQEQVSRAYASSMTLVHLTTANLAVPTSNARGRLESLFAGLAVELKRQGEGIY